MAAMMKSAAASAVNRGAPSSFYSDSKNNPVIQALDQEIKLFENFMKKRAAGGNRQNDEPASRSADALFELWNKYEPRLPVLLYQKKLLAMGDFLVSVKEYNLALWQCYERYLRHFGDVNVEEIKDVNVFKKSFFPEGFDTEDAGFTFRALMGKSICTYQVIRQTDPKLQNVEYVERAVHLLSFLRLVTQVILPNEPLCWLVYNGTVHIYSISRHMMSLGHSAKVVEYLLWACMCMESSVPLLGVRHLRWRSTLYTAVCQCYYDCRGDQHAEAFARRALAKINELSQLESLSNAGHSLEAEATFRQATIRMATMVFKRTVFETRRKPKGLLRPKTRANLKDAQGLPWPRTPTEKMLADMFEGSAAQMLCLVEALSDSNRRTLLHSPPASDQEVEILDVFAELFLAAQELISGGGGASAGTANRAGPELTVPGMAGVITDGNLMEMATKGEDGVPLSCVIKVVKYAYCYEQWDVFESLIHKTLEFIRELEDSSFSADEKSLELLLAVAKVTHRRSRRQPQQTTGGDAESEGGNAEEVGLPLPPSQQVAPPKTGQDSLVFLADVLMSIINGRHTQDELDIDMFVDATILLWNKCKAVFQRYQTGSADNARYLQKMDNPGKWVYLLDIIHRAIGWCGLSSVDPALTAEVVLRLALVLEASAESPKQKNKPRAELSTSRSREQDLEPSTIRSQEAEDDQSITSSKDGHGSAADPQTPGSVVDVGASRGSMFTASVLFQSPQEQLSQARSILQTGLQNVSSARQAVALTDGKSIADISWAKELNPGLFAPVTESSQSPRKSEIDGEEDGEGTDATAVWNTVRDLHLELLYMYHRVGLKLTTHTQDGSGNPKKNRGRANVKQTAGGPCYDDLVSDCRKHQLSKALLLMQKALMAKTGKNNSADSANLLKDAQQLILKAQNEEKRLYLENTGGTTDKVRATKVPPAPVLLCRTDRSMVFKPAKFIPQGGEKVAWYRIFGKSAAGSNVKVRLNDYFLPGTGEEVPAFSCELRVSGMTPAEKYVFAVAAYTADGKLIGDGVGETSKPILASHPLPALMTWAYLAQVAYQVGLYETSKEACDVLWDHFVAQPSPPEGDTYTTSAKQDFALTLHRLNLKVVSETSPVLLRMFLTSIFIHVDINVRQGVLFCDALCDKGPLNKAQVSRLRQCELMLVAVELAGWLNEASLALQAVVQCYGLLVPLLYYKIPAVPVIQVLERCQSILQEIPVSLRQRRQQAITDSLHHMTACLTFHMARVLRTWGQRTLANSVNETGRRLLAIDKDQEVPADQEVDWDNQDKILEESTLDPLTETGSLTLAALKKKKGGKKGQVAAKDEPEVIGNEELKALEAHMLRLSKQAQGEHELNGNEDPSILHAYIAYLPSRLAYREVLKFKRRAQYLEFFVQVAQKALSEGCPDLALEWCEETVQWLAKRNENLVGVRAVLSLQPGALTAPGEESKKFAAALVEYQKDKGKDQTPRKPGAGVTKPAQKQRHKKPKYKLLGGKPNMTDAQRQAQEEKELKALEVLSMFFVDLYHTSHRRKRLRKVCTDEGPWRVQLNMLRALSQFGVFLNKMEQREKIMGMATSHIYDTNFLDHEWFTFETAGTLVVGWDGGPSRQVTRQSQRDPFMKPGESDTARGREQVKVSGMDVAAAAATGRPPPPLYPVPQEEEDTPRTYRSETGRNKAPRPPQTEAEPMGMITADETHAMLTRTFDFFRKAVVLSHRGKLWTLLQNTCGALWNCAHTALLRACSSNREGGPFLTLQQIRSIMWRPFCMAADCLLDMLLQLQNQPQTSKKGTKKDSGEQKLDSLMGSVKDEKGGASLRFESSLDDLSVLDLRWIRRFILRVLEMLYYERKWENLVDIGLRFSALSGERYAEQVYPLLVQAQRKLLNRIEMNDGAAYPQPHFVPVLKQTGGLINPKQYTSLQLKIQPSEMSLESGPLTDAEGSEGFSGALHALKLCSVPLDVAYSLDTLRSVLDKSQYTSRALQHSRRLLVLYLAGQQNGKDDRAVSSQSAVDFVPTTARPQPTMPPDNKRDEYLSMDDVQTYPMPRSQVGVVISSYDKTIDLLMASNQRGLGAEAMKEVGSLHYHTGNIRGAYKMWSDALDVILQKSDVIHCWRQMMSTDAGADLSAVLLQKCGLWGCVLGGILASNIAQYILTSDLGLRMECCFLSAYFLKALFRASLPHPTADRDYAMYEVGEGCEVTNLVPGIDLLSDRFRCDGRTLVSALRYVMEELARGRHNLFVLPLLTLYQYFTTFVCRDLQRSVEGRILRVRVLTDLGLYTEAFIVLQRLLHGERLPQTSDSNFRQVESRMSSVRFNTSKPVQEPCNLKVMEQVIDKRLSSSLGTLYGSYLTCQLSLAQAHLLITLADTVPVLPSFDDTLRPPGSSGPLQPHTISTISKGGPKIASKGASSTRVSQQKKPEVLEEDESQSEESAPVRQGTQRFTSSKKPVSLELIKGTLLGTADQILTTLNDILVECAKNDKGLESMNPAETELAVLCKLELAGIARQRQHAAMAARLALGSMKVLQSANVLKEKKDVGPSVTRRTSSMRGDRRFKAAQVKLVDPEANQYQYQNFQSRARLDARLWLNCRKALVQSMLGEIRGMGEVKGSERLVKVELADVRQYVAEGVAESETCGDVEMNAEFLMFASILDHMEGRHTNHVLETLKEVLDLLNQVPQLSTPGSLLQTMALLYQTDLKAASLSEDKSHSVTQRSLQDYTQVQLMLLQQLESHGERTEHFYPRGEHLERSTLCSPIRNLYLPHMLHLVQTKLRIGHAMARNAVSNNMSAGDTNTLWQDPLGVLATALELSQVSITRVASVEAEILLNMGKIQRQLCQQGLFPGRAAANTLIQAITTSYSNDHNLGLMRQAYLELALVYLTSAGQLMQKEAAVMESAADSEDDAHSTSSSSPKPRKKKTKPVQDVLLQGRKDKGKKQSQEAEDEGDQERRAAWTAIRCAAAVAEAQRHRLLLIGDTATTSQPISSKSLANLPEFVALDLVSSYVLGERKRIYKNEIEEELAPLTEALEPPQPDTYEDQIQRAREATQGLSWVQVLGYQAMLQRLCSTATLTVMKEGQEAVAPDEGTEQMSEFDLGFISHTNADNTLNHDVVMSVLFSPTWCLRLNYLHQYLVSNLQAYATNCTAVYPPKTVKLDPTDQGTGTKVHIIYKSYGANKSVPLDVKADASQMEVPSAPGSQTDLTKPSDQAVLSVTDGELCLQWYMPALDNVTTVSDTGESSTNIRLLYSITTKPDRSSPPNTNSAALWLSLKQLADLHDKLTVLCQRGEISLEDKKSPKKENPREGATSRALTRRQTRIKPLSPKIKKDEKLEALLRQCMSDTQLLFGITPHAPEEAVTEESSEALDLDTQPAIPFKVNRSNMHHFERLFDPNGGHMLRDPKMLVWFSQLFTKPAEAPVRVQSAKEHQPVSQRETAGSP